MRVDMEMLKFGVFSLGVAFAIATIALITIGRKSNKKEKPVKKGRYDVMKYLRERYTNNTLGFDHMIFYPGGHTNYGAELKKERDGTVMMEIWNVSPWPDDTSWIEYTINPRQVAALKYFLKQYEEHISEDDAHPEPVSMLPVPRGVTLLDMKLRDLEKLNKKLEEHNNRKKSFWEELFGF